MAAVLGPNELKQYAIPATWDATRLKNVSLQSGETYEQLISDISGALSIANADLIKDPLIGSLTRVTTEPTVEYGIGAANPFERHTERGVPDAQRGAMTGHMLPNIPWDGMLGWTWDFLRKARRSQIDYDIELKMIALPDLFKKTVLTRHFKSTYDAVGTGKSVPYADGGTADSTWIPRPVLDRGGTFLSTHNHFLRLNGITQANLETAVQHLWEHGYDAPYDLLVSESDLASWSDVTAVTGYIKKPDALIRYGTQTDLANVGDDYIGSVETRRGAVRMRANGRIPTGYWSVYKSDGIDDPRNPLLLYTSPQFGLGAVLLAGDHIRQFPLENAILFVEFGVGVNKDRAKSVVVYNFASGNYVDPTIS
jgi:hypothetical protein